MLAMSLLSSSMHILGVGKLLAIPFSEDSSQFGAILELSHPTQMEIVSRSDGLTSQINNLEGNQSIFYMIHIIYSCLYLPGVQLLWLNILQHQSECLQHILLISTELH